MRTRGVAIAGTGFIGPVHVEAVRRLGHRVLGILGSSLSRGREAAARLGIERAYTSLPELLADPQVEVVHLATPNRLHFEQCRLVLAAGKHLICEKPLAMNSAETGELVRLAASSRVVTAVNYNVRFYPLCLEARERRIAGSLGRILHVSGTYLQDWLLHETDFNWRVLSSEGGPLRAVADIGTHWLDLICFITGLEVEAVCADLATVHAVRKVAGGSIETFQTVAADRPLRDVPIDTEDHGSILLRFRGGARGCLTVSQVVAGRKNRIQFDLAGSSASLSWDSEEPNLLFQGHRDRANESLIRDPSLLTPASRRFADYPGGHAEGFPDSFKQLFRAIYSAIDGETPAIPFPTFEDGHREVLLCEAILASHREQRWVRLPD